MNLWEPQLKRRRPNKSEEKMKNFLEKWSRFKQDPNNQRSPDIEA
jgi:hypothetical protein